MFVLLNMVKNLAKHICLALDEIDKAVEIMRAYNSGLSGRIRIGSVISIQRNLFTSSFEYV